MKYWAVGINGNIDDDFLNEKEWSTDYPESDDEGLKHRKWIKDKISIGDKVALKTINRINNSLKIFALGTIIEKYDDYSGFKVDWIKENPIRETNSSYGQAKTIAQVLDKDAIFDIFGTSLNNYKKVISDMKIKNIILYGSPGVGKTHNTNKLIRLIEDGKSDREIFETIKVNENSDTIDISDIKERVKFVTFHQSFGYEDFIEGFRPNEEGNIELEDGIFKNICNDARINFTRSIKYTSTLEQDEKQEKLFELFIDEVENEIEKNGKYYINSTVYITDVEGDAFRYQGINWKNSQRMKFDDIKLICNFHGFTRKSIKDIPNISGLAKQHATYFAYLATKFFEFSEAQNIEIDEIEKEEQKNYYLVIDEINRGNISKIFGELITLIEEDKRDTLEVTLPYSKKSFKIPSNLYIIGTMNSTDKSIALIDIALRRRFTFLKMKPKADLISYQKARLIFEVVNKKIIETLGEDYQIGHSYFMKIQNDHDLDSVLEYKIIPLLEEYYYGDDRSTEVIALCKQDITWSNNE